MRELPLIIVLLVILVFLFSVFTDMVPPAVSNPARSLYNTGALVLNDLIRTMGYGAAGEYFILLPKR